MIDTSDHIKRWDNDMTFDVQHSQFIGFGFSWNRRNIFDFGWITIELPFFSLILEWPPDEKAWEAKYGRKTE